MSENGEIYTTGKNFTLPPALTAWTNSTSAVSLTEKKLPAMVWGVGCGVSSWSKHTSFTNIFCIGRAGTLSVDVGLGGGLQKSPFKIFFD